MDYITGVAAAFRTKTLKSSVGFEGLMKKCAIFLIVILAAQLDRITGNAAGVFRTSTAFFFTLKVTKNVVRVDGKNTVQRSTKTESGKRTIPLNGRAVESIRHLKEQRTVGCPYVFATQTGKYLSYRNLLAIMEKACETAEVEHRGLHALRHSFASNLYARGVEVKIISKLLGHASVEITYNRYIHFFEGEIDDTLRQAVGA